VRAGGWRVGEAGLQVTRSVGDADLKDQGVTAEAETVELALTPGDSFLVAATDGLWDRIRWVREWLASVWAAVWEGRQGCMQGLQGIRQPGTAATAA
jgi:serine/threonine protein phosphatase PrpC